MITTVLVPIDGSPRSASVLAPARALAERTGATLLLLTSSFDAEPVADEERLAKYAADVGYARVETRLVRQKFAGPAILANADDPETLVCMATHGRTGLRGAWLGSVAEEIITESRHPVLLFGPEVDARVWESEERFAEGKVVCPVDGSPPSMAVLPVARDRAELLGLDLCVVEVVPPAPPLQLDPRDQDVPRTQHAAEMLADLEGSPDWEVLEGDDVPKTLTDYAGRLPATLFVMATHANPGAKRSALGSVTMQVVQRSPVPVLVARSYVQ